MLFVLDERLKSQSAAAERVLALIADIIDGMFEKAWVESMFTAKDLPPAPSVYATFAQFAHSSMMTLSASRHGPISLTAHAIYHYVLERLFTRHASVSH